MQPEPLTIAIQPDGTAEHRRPEHYNASAPRWAELLKRDGHRVRWVDVFQPDILQQLQGCDGFMWRWKHLKGDYRVALRLLPVLERQWQMPVFPNLDTCWHYDDKIAQNYLLEAAGIPIPRTWAWFDPQQARDWIRDAEYPLVLKLAGGAGAENVRLISGPAEASEWIDHLFGDGVFSLSKPRIAPTSLRNRLRSIYRSWFPVKPGYRVQRHRGYILFQEFLPGNAFDTRVTVIGDRAFGFRRFNRENDFRASGSGKLDHNPDEIDPAFVRLAFEVARKLRQQSVAIDGLMRGEECLVGEISYTYASWAVHVCPGHWMLAGDPQTGPLLWHEGHMWPEDAQLEVFLQSITPQVLV